MLDKLLLPVQFTGIAELKIKLDINNIMTTAYLLTDFNSLPSFMYFKPRITRVLIANYSQNILFYVCNYYNSIIILCKQPIFVNIFRINTHFSALFKTLIVDFIRSIPCFSLIRSQNSIFYVYYFSNSQKLKINIIYIDQIYN